MHRNSKARSLPSRSRADVIYTIHLPRRASECNLPQPLHDVICKFNDGKDYCGGQIGVLELTASASGCGNRLPTHTALKMRHNPAAHAKARARAVIEQLAERGAADVGPLVEADLEMGWPLT